MRGSARHWRAWFVLPLVCLLGIGSGCSLDLLVISFCASEQQGISTDGSSTFTSAQGGVSVLVGDSVRLVAHGFCHDAGLHIVIASSSTQWHSHDRSIVRVSPAADSAANADAAAWAVGMAPGSTVVSAESRGSLASLAVNVRAR